ncbi:sensor histidine kinase [Microbacterium oleivorans]|uniref:histidine kinase n=1 Tax=Microbacterium oleivorans TaxID=273677 RepID=A0A7D5EXD9_9MICO|nr:ATP-binding protein [Microbacterium oleivorans]QLD12024.1 HAMP domain-containing protein [Microbacterium oleivorans]
MVAERSSHERTGAAGLPPRRGIRSASLRARITAIATAAVALVMVLGSIAFAAVLSASIQAAAERGAETRIEELAARVEAQGVSAVTALDDEIAQVQDAAGAVIAASDDADDGALPRTASGATVSVDGERMLLVREEIDDDRYLVLAVPLDDADETLGTVVALLAVSTVLVVALVAVVTWWVVGRALRPVSRIRAEVEAITADRLDRRIAEPRSRDEIAALAATMNSMLGRLDDAAAAQRRFVSDASHELRSPLATIRQHAELARAHPEATSLGDLAEVVVDEGVRMQDLVDGLLLLARLDERAPQRRQSVDLDDLALAEASRLRGRDAGPEAGAGGNTVEVDASGITAARVAGDPRMLARLVRNLADNAARHARSRVRISTALTPDGRRAVLEVEDDGSGIPPGEHDRVFQRFVRLDEARARDAGGSGLGLAIVRGIAEATGGSVALSASPLGGARFTVTLPAGT